MHHDHLALILLELALVIGLSMFGRIAASSLNQPSVLGELLIGVVFAGLVHLGGGSLSAIVHDINIFGNLGVILLLFLVGLETNVQDMIKVGPRASMVAGMGVAAPLILGSLCGYWLAPHSTLPENLFIGATLCATSVGITARVFKDLNALASNEAKLVLGAAVIDDVLGLVLLGVVSGIAINGNFEFLPALKLVVLAALFLGSIIWFGEKMAAEVVPNLLFLEPQGRRLLIPLVICFLFSWLAGEIGLAAIVGAFAAGLILRDRHFEVKKGEAPTIYNEIAPVEALFAPVFFVLMGLQVDLSSLLHSNILFLAIGLCFVAIVGKLACALVSGPEVDGSSVGIGMLPRGEVGLIFAGVGRSLEVLDDELFAALVIMIIFTTLIAPPALRWSMARTSRD